MKKFLFVIATVCFVFVLNSDAQVAGLCGAGKNCNVRTITAKGTQTGPAAYFQTNKAGISVCYDNAAQEGYSWAVQMTTSNYNLGWFNSDNCTSSYTPILSANVNNGIVNIAKGIQVTGTLGYRSTGVATGSLDTPAPSLNEIQYDTTTNTWKVTGNGSAWAELQTGTDAIAMSWNSFSPAAYAGGTETAWALYKVTNGETTVDTSKSQCVVVTAGSGTINNVVARVYNTTGTPEDEATFTFACNAAAGTAIAAGAGATGDGRIANSDQLRMDWGTVGSCSTMPAINCTVFLN